MPISSDAFVTIAAGLIAVSMIVWLARQFGKVAEAQGRNYYLWAVVGVLLPLPAVLILFIFRKRRAPKAKIASQF